MNPSTEKARRTRTRAVRIAVLVAVAGPVGAIATGAIVSKAYWGHFFGRPTPDWRLREAAGVISATSVKLVADGRGGLRVVSAAAVFDARAMVAAASGHAEYPHYFLDERVLEALLPLLPSEGPAAPKDEALSVRTAAAIATRDLLVKADADSARLGGDDAEGLIIELAGPSRARFVVAALAQGQVSNDHHPYHEILFSIAPDGSVGRVVSHRRFYFDVAGFEGMDWRAVSMCAAFPLTGGSILAALVILGRGLFLASRMTKGLCARCRYDLTGNTSGRCPECGTATPEAQTMRTQALRD